MPGSRGLAAYNWLRREFLAGAGRSNLFYMRPKEAADKSYSVRMRAVYGEMCGIASI